MLTPASAEKTRRVPRRILRPKLSDEAMAKVRETELAKCVELRKMYNDAGVNIHIHKTPFGSSDADIDFNFQIAKALGCKAITTERNDKLAKKLAPFAEKHKIYVAFHNHTNNVPKIDEPDPLFELSPYIAFNLDIGHYVAGTKGKSPIPVIEKYHERIINLHLKDRTADGGNLPWGQGQTPIKEVLQLLKKEQWPIYGDIELEYAIPKGSNVRGRSGQVRAILPGGAGISWAAEQQRNHPCAGEERARLVQTANVLATVHQARPPQSNVRRSRGCRRSSRGNGYGQRRIE